MRSRQNTTRNKNRLTRKDVASRNEHNMYVQMNIQKDIILYAKTKYLIIFQKKNKFLFVFIKKFKSTYIY